MTMFVVKSEYWDMWAVSNDKEAIVSEQDIASLAEEWETGIDVIMGQVNVYE